MLIRVYNIMMMWPPWTNLSHRGMAVKATFVAVVLIAAAASSFLEENKAESSANESSMKSLAERFVNEATAPTKKDQEMTTPAQLRHLQENKRKDRKKATYDDGQSMVTNAAKDCTSQFCQKQLSDACLVEYKVNNGFPTTITMVLVCEGSRWVGIGFSESGQMMNSDAVLGIPGTAPEKYRLGGYDQSAVVAMEKQRQTLTDASVNYYDADDVTVLKFTKIMKEDGEVEITPGKNTFLYAKGIFEDLNYHQERDLFELNIPEADAASEVAPAAEESSEKKRKDRDKVKKDDDSAEDPSAENQPKESKRKQGRGDGKQTLAEQFASLGPIQLRPLKDLRPNLSPPVPVDDEFPYPYPKIRFTEWASLSHQTREIMKENFGYNKGNWNALGLNDNERMTCSQLTDAQRQAIQLLGWNCDVWDCFINHYKTYNAEQLGDKKLLGHVDVVRSAWVKLWADLSEDELQSATRLCFTEFVWDVGYLGAS